MALTKSNFHKKNFTLTTSWDDGYDLDLRIVKLLQKYKLPGTFYIVVDWVGKSGFLSWPRIQELDKIGFKIGSHTISHPQDLKTLFDEDLYYEVQNSKDMLETALGHCVDSFCYPRGRADERVKRFVANAGYIEARGTGEPGVIKVEDKLYLPGTIHIFQREEYEHKTIFDFTREVIDRLVSEGGYCNIWGHSSELEKFSLWGTLEEILRYTSEVMK
jgi:peptidoglycan/xylan/chitin deacetylase (PgdA/CDA1 family)